jgi:hypothetical protein
MKVTYLDLKTGRTAQEAGISEFQLTENNWSCDCNRSRAFGLDNPVMYCSAQRFVAIAVEKEPEDEWCDDDTPESIVAAANRDYYYGLLYHSRETYLNRDGEPLFGESGEVPWVKIDEGEE